MNSCPHVFRSKCSYLPTYLPSLSSALMHSHLAALGLLCINCLYCTAGWCSEHSQAMALGVYAEHLNAACCNSCFRSAVIKYQTRNHFLEDGFFDYDLKRACGKEGMLAGAWGSWCHCAHSQEAGDGRSCLSPSLCILSVGWYCPHWWMAFSSHLT